MTNIRTVMGSMDLDQLLSHRDEINDRLLRVVDAAASPWGVKINRIEIKDIVPPKDLVDSHGPPDEGRAREARRRCWRPRASARPRCCAPRATRRRRSWRPRAASEAAFRDAEARERSAEAEAKATQMVSEAIAAGDMGAINYFVAQQYVKALQAIASAPNQKVLMMPLEASSLIGTLGGIGEIVRDSFGPDRPPPASGQRRSVPDAQSAASRAAAARAVSSAMTSEPSLGPGTPPAGPWGPAGS